ncbi:MAG: lytic transglycosylase domain-containing protein [Sphingomonadales bacterium]|nr:lytic transglycosylase domain-containing protein [Sphingomonadales bacterium]MBK9269017.1 lytic transglycosylase domain-containing protein [Sphingomonadales bacterium]
MVDPSGGNVPAALQRWRMLSQSGQYSFSEYASFLMTYPDWPNSDEMRKNAEQAINVLSWSPNQAVAYFDRLEPVTNGGRAKFALALSATGDKARAEQWARRAWREGPLTDDDENRLFQLMAGKLTAADHDARTSRLLWSNATRAAQKWLPYTSSERRPVLEAQLAHELKAPDAAAKFAAVGTAGLSDAGLLMERVASLRTSGNSWSARELLANRPQLSAPPHVARDWLKVLLTNAEAAETDGQFDMAYRIASKLTDAFPAGTDITKLDLSTRDIYTSLAWLAGETAYYKLGRPRDATEMFKHYVAGARTPQTRAKGFYWAGRAAKKAGDQQVAQQYLTEAARYYDFFHGQLALEALGRPLPAVPASPILPQLAANTVPPTYTAARMSSSFPGWRDSNSFMRALSNSAKTESDFKNLFAWSNLIGRPDLSVIAARSARIEGYDGLIRLGYPTVAVPPEHTGNWTFIHAIARQESQFDRNAVSHAGARGLMQLMPGTARETSGKIALAYRPEALNSDTNYNIQLGSTYFQRMLNYYNGSYPLAVAAYNAGPGNVNKWLARNGDPRSGGIDILDWIERIPIFETRNYVQRVLENAVMYDHLNPDKARYRNNAPLSHYLGRRSVG